MRINTRDIDCNLIEEIIEILEGMKKKPIAKVAKELDDLIEELNKILEI